MDSRGFAPLARGDARVLVLGSLPGAESLRQRRYYAQPRNAFWPIMGELFGAGPERPYEVRVRRLLARRVAVWDVCQRAYRPGSLDTAIVRDSVVVNDFAAFLRAHPGVALIAFNGATAESLYRRLVLPRLGAQASALPSWRLPSTSPAHASVSYRAKLAAWTALSAAAAPGRGRRVQAGDTSRLRR